MSRHLLLFLGLILVATPLFAAERNTRTSSPSLREVFLVGNNWDGTADVFDVETYQFLKQFNVVPDLSERKKEITGFFHPISSLYFSMIQKRVGEGNNQLVDDLFTSLDGRTLFASRPSLRDVVAIDMQSGAIKWRNDCEGYRSDHAAISPDGKTFLVSCTTAKKVLGFDTKTGRVVDSFSSGYAPHENTYINNGRKILHANIGDVTKKTAGTVDWTHITRTGETSPSLIKDFELKKNYRRKGARHLHIVNVKHTQEGERYSKPQKIDMGERIQSYFGGKKPPVDRAVRPMAVAGDEKSIFLQISFYHGFFEYELPTPQHPKGRVVDHWDLYIPRKVQSYRPDQYQLNSAHHGIAINGNSDRLCVAGTMDGYIAIVDRQKNKHGEVVATYFSLVYDKKAQSYTMEALEERPSSAKPYWATETRDGNRCLVSVSQLDKVWVVNFGDKGKGVAPHLEAILNTGHRIDGEDERGLPYSLSSVKFRDTEGNHKKMILSDHHSTGSSLGVRYADKGKGEFLHRLSHPQRVRNGYLLVP